LADLEELQDDFVDLPSMAPLGNQASLIRRRSSRLTSQKNYFDNYFRTSVNINPFNRETSLIAGFANQK